MEQKQQFVSLAVSGRYTVTELCLEFGISRKTGHKWLRRHGENGMAGLEDRSRAPKSVTGRTADDVERLIVCERRLHPTWGPKKIHDRLVTSLSLTILLALLLGRNEARGWRAWSARAELFVQRRLVLFAATVCGTLRLAIL